MDRCYIFSDLGGTLRLVGRLDHEDRVIGKFQYARSFLESGEAFPLDPLNLPLSDAEIMYRRSLDQELPTKLTTSANNSEQQLPQS